MSITENRGELYGWLWIEAFDKFGFNDGDDPIQTHRVVEVLQEAGYEVEVADAFLHNSFICSVRKDGTELIPEGTETGYDDPYDYLPQEVITLLDMALPS